METKVTVIVDNIAYEGIAGEWGLSILVEYEILIYVNSQKKLFFTMHFS